MSSTASLEATRAFNSQIKWENMLRPGYCKKGRDLAGVPFPIIYIRDVGGVTKDDILQEMKKMGVEISYPTLNRYVNAGLVTKPVNVNSGRGKGQISQYPTRALFEAYAAWNLLNGPVKISKDDIKMAREIGPNAYLEGKYDYRIHFWLVRTVIAFLAWKYQEISESTLSLFGPKPSSDITFWEEQNLRFPDDNDDIVPEMQDEHILGSKYIVRMTKKNVRIYRKSNGWWVMISKNDIGKIINME